MAKTLDVAVTFIEHAIDIDELRNRVQLLEEQLARCDRFEDKDEDKEA